MLNPISVAFKKAKAEKRPALLTYTVAGDSSKKQSLDILKSISKNADILEVGVPHNTPVADGSQIQTSAYRAIKKGIKINDIFKIVRDFKKFDKKSIQGDSILPNFYKILGVDTEFRRTTKDNMRLALLQVNDDEEIFLIDTIAIDNPGQDASFLFSESVLKIFHSCKEDLEAIFSWTNKKMCNVFDTQIANAFLNGDYSVSYRLLVEKKLGIILEKNETRSNWLRRPLTDSQLKYASLDVEYLINLFLDQFF